MKTSYFYSPTHPSKICDIALEVIVNTYYVQGINIHSNIFSYIYDDVLYLNGSIKANDIIGDSDLLHEIEKEIGNDYKIVNNITTTQTSEVLEERTFSGVYLGYSCLEVDEMIPFEHEIVKYLTKKLYDELNLPLKCQVHVNGNLIVVSLEHNHDNFQEINAIVKDFLKYEDDENRPEFNEPIIHHNIIRKDMVYKSNDIISTFYGPRAWYGETDYIGFDFLSNKRIGHLIAREIALDWGKKNVLSYCAIELDFTSDVLLPIHFGKKGNENGIHLENGTFFEFGDIENEYPMYKQKVLNKIKTGEIDIIEIAKWGFQNINT